MQYRYAIKICDTDMHIKVCNTNMQYRYAMQICNADMQCRYVKEICNNAVRGSAAPGTNIYPQRRAITAAQAAEAEEAAEAAEAAAEAAEAAEAEAVGGMENSFFSVSKKKKQRTV